MTRFARAKGSKSCNMKQPEEPTSWAEMKKGMQRQLAKEKDHSSARNALDSVKKKKKDDDKPVVWGTLGNATNPDASDALDFMKAQLKKRKEKNHVVKGLSGIKNEGVGDDCKKQKKKRKKEEKDVVNVVEVNEEVPEKKNKKLKKVKNDEAVNLIVDDVGKKSNKRKQNVESKEEVKKKKSKEDKNEIVEEIQNGGNKIKDKKKQKDDKNEEMKNDETTTEKGKKRKSNDTSEAASVTKKKKNVAEKTENSVKPTKDNKSKKLDRKKKFEQLEQKRREKREKLKDLLPQDRRRKPLPETHEVHINGQTVRLQMFDGFWVTHEDAERLKKLKNDMFDKNLPLKDINGAIKLERRRAEKALARLKKKVCFQCRKSGHALSECPEISESPDKANNVCYKCGSTEHTAYLCKVSSGNQFRFAECFVCKEQGHIAKQCPDNPRGMYPRGGACKQCGDVTHLKKDCPEFMSMKEEATISVGVRNDRMIEDLEEQLVDVKNNSVTKSNAKRKHVRF